jgi:hypothetical protein
MSKKSIYLLIGGAIVLYALLIYTLQNGVIEIKIRRKLKQP